MSQVAKPENSEAHIVPAAPAEKENLIHLSAEAQMKLAGLVLNPPPQSPEISLMQAIHTQLVRNSCE